MVGIVTDDLKHTLSEFILEDSAAKYYIGVGKPDSYDSSDTTSTPINSNFEEQEARSNLMSVKRVDNVSYVIPRFNWTSGTIYDAWSDASVGVPSNTFYVLTEDNEVYICIQKGIDNTGNANQSTVKPSFTNAGVAETAIFQTADGYKWKLAYTLSTARANIFLTSGFMPVEYVKNITGPNTVQTQQKTIEANADSGAIVGVRIIDGGTGYVGATTQVNFLGNGSGASATATISGGSIVKVEMNDSAAAVGNGGGRDYSYASATVTGNATLKPILSSKNGLGSDILRDLKASSVMFNVKTVGNENNTFTTLNDFRQITLFRGLHTHAGAGSPAVPITGTGYKVGRFVDLTQNASAVSISADATITDDTLGVTATIIEKDSDGSNPAGGKARLRFIQNQNNVMGAFGANNTLNTSSFTVGTHGDSNGYVDIYSGDLLYIENRAKIQRANDQTEDIKIILTV